MTVPAVIVGRPMQQSGSTVPAISEFVDDDRHAFAQRTLGQRTFLALGIAAIVLMVLDAVAVRTARGSRRVGLRGCSRRRRRWSSW